MAPPPFPPGPGQSADQFNNMVAGRAYNGDSYLQALLHHTAALLAEANATISTPDRQKAFAKFIDFRKGDRGGSFIMSPFMCEYGFNISIGDDCFIGPNNTWLDVAPIHIGHRTMIAANTQIYTPSHPILPEERNGLRGPEWAKPITIGDDCWIGGGVIICPGVTIGNGVTVGAGSVVTKDVEDRVVVAGNPARVIKKLPPVGESIDGNYKPVGGDYPRPHLNGVKAEGENGEARSEPTSPLVRPVEL
ncbi:hypothetical protein CspHIS471_0602350 [Cutaneotrichosporon sp. HIS471]|nr:hypothetical protein CspHIS471_0602350 [Cutaneotrichosporon sp. HIS471]